MKVQIGEYELELGNKIIIETDDLTKDDIKQIEYSLANTSATYRVEQ